MLTQCPRSTAETAEHAEEGFHCDLCELCGSVFFLSPRRPLSGGANAPDIHQRHRARRLDALRFVPSSRRNRSLQPAHVRRCQASRRADRVVTSRRIMRRGNRRRAKASSWRAALNGPRAESAARWLRAARPKATPPISPLEAGTEDGWRSRSPAVWPHAGHRTRAGRRHRTSFRTFVIPIPWPRAIRTRRWQFRPGNARVVHHANPRRRSRTRSSRQLDGHRRAPCWPL